MKKLASIRRNPIDEDSFIILIFDYDETHNVLIQTSEWLKVDIIKFDSSILPIYNEQNEIILASKDNNVKL